MMIMNAELKTAMFLDGSKARIIHWKDGQASFSETLESEFESHPRYRGEGSNQARFGTDPYHGSNNEYGKNKQEQELKKSYYHRLKDRLLPYQEILLFGAGQAKKEMFKYLQSQSAFRDKKIFVKNSDHITDNQLLETVREFFAEKEA
jgi:hypothetical protein